MAISTETYRSDGNTILKLDNKYSTGTVTGKYIENSETITINITELGEEYIEISAVPLGVDFKIEYTILGTLTLNSQEEFDLKERIKRLEKGFEDMYVIIQAQQKALDNRLSVSSFKAWTGLIEKKLGIKLVDGNLNYLDREIFK